MEMRKCRHWGSRIDPLRLRYRRRIKRPKNGEENGWWKQWFDVEGFGFHLRKLYLYSIFMGILAKFSTDH